MPSPKAGTVTPDVARAVNEAKAGKIEYRLDKTNIIHCPIGKVSFGKEKLAENFYTLLDAIIKAKPAAAKGQYIRSCVVATTMGPGIKINPTELQKRLNSGLEYKTKAHLQRQVRFLLLIYYRFLTEKQNTHKIIGYINTKISFLFQSARVC